MVDCFMIPTSKLLLYLPQGSDALNGLSPLHLARLSPEATLHVPTYTPTIYSVVAYYLLVCVTRMTISTHLGNSYSLKVNTLLYHFPLQFFI